MWGRPARSEAVRRHRDESMLMLGGESPDREAGGRAVSHLLQALGGQLCQGCARAATPPTPRGGLGQRIRAGIWRCGHGCGRRVGGRERCGTLVGVRTGGRSQPHWRWAHSGRREGDDEYGGRALGGGGVDVCCQPGRGSVDLRRNHRLPRPSGNRGGLDRTELSSPNVTREMGRTLVMSMGMTGGRMRVVECVAKSSHSTVVGTEFV